MAVENGYGTELDMVVDEENQENEGGLEKSEVDEKNSLNENDGKNSLVSNKEESVVSNKEDSTSNTNDDEPTTTVVMEVDEEQENEPLVSENDCEDRIITASVDKNEKSNENKNDMNSNGENSGVDDNENQNDAPPPEPVVTEYVKEYSGKLTGRSSRSISNSVSVNPVKIKQEPSEIVLIDSEDEKDEKPKVKVVAARNVQVKQSVKPAGRSATNSVSNSRNNSDFQIVSVDDDSPMNKNDPMNVFLCSTEEREFRKDYFKDPSSNVLKQRLHCTICDIHIGACPQNSKNMVCHRFLKVLICRKCANFYGQGDFPQDDGSDEFCRWCGEGGEVFLCNSCSNVFCQACILRNFGMAEVKRVDRLENWDCYVCNTRPLWTLRAIAFALFTYVRRIKVVAYRNGMYQTINSSNAKVSKSDLMALETDLSTCCPKEVKAAAAAASAPPPSETEKHSSAVKPKENKTVNQTSTPRTPANKVANQNNKTPEGSVQFVSNSVYGQQPPPAPRSSSKRPKQQPPKQIPSPASWQQPQPQLLPEYYPGPGPKRVPNQPSPYAISQPSVMYPAQSTLRTALVGQQPSFVPSPPMIPNSFASQNHMLMFGGAAMPGGKDVQSEPNVFHWFNGILISLMDTMKNIDNRLVFIRNSMSNLISQNEVSFLVNQLHNLLKVSCSKMQEVDCDLLKNYKEFIDKSEIRVNDFDEIVREFPEFFKPTENSTGPPESNDTDPDPPDDINPMALVEVIEEGDQPALPQPQQSQSPAVTEASKQTSNGNTNEKNPTQLPSTSDSTPSSKKSSPLIFPCSVTIKKEIIPFDDSADHSINDSTSTTLKSSEKPVNDSLKRKSDTKDTVKSKVQMLEKFRIKKEIEEFDDDDGHKSVELEKSVGIKKCSVALENVNINNLKEGKS